MVHMDISFTSSSLPCPTDARMNLAAPSRTNSVLFSKSVNVHEKPGARRGPSSFDSVVLIGLKVSISLLGCVEQSLIKCLLIGPEKDASGIWKQWGVEQSSQLARRAVAEAGIDLIDVSSGGNWVAQKIPARPSYQVPLAESIKNANPNILVTAVGLITDAHQAEDIVKDKANGGKGLDAVWLAREFLRNADFALKAAEELGVVVRSVVQYERAWSRFYSIQKNKL